jgi:hypothetical protein
MEHPTQQSARQSPVDVAEIIRNHNSANKTHEGQWVRIHQAGDAVRGVVAACVAARYRARQALDSYLAAQAESPQRCAPLPRQWLIAVFTLGLDTIPSYFAAQALGNGQLQTLIWTVLFVALLVSLTAALEHYGDRGGRPWSLVLAGLGAFVAGLAILRYLFLLTVDFTGPAAALLGALLFTAITVGFLTIGYRALRAAERVPVWQARRRARKAEREEIAVGRRMSQLVQERDHLADAYLSRIRLTLLDVCSVEQLPLVETAVRDHLTGGDL